MKTNLKTITLEMVFVVHSDDLQEEIDNVQSAINASLEWDDWPRVIWSYEITDRKSNHKEALFYNKETGNGSYRFTHDEEGNPVSPRSEDNE